jgi:uncharacterized LabA/DUF88 family protein
MVFIDGSNFYHALKQARGDAKIDFAYLVKQIVGQRRLMRAYYYNAPVNRNEVPEQYKRQQRFFAGIQALDYFELRLGELVRRADHMIEKGVDVRLAVDMVAFAAKDLYDTAVVVSADGDFAHAIQYVKDMGKHVEVAYLPQAKARRLRQVCDKFIPLGGDYLRDAPSN